LFLKIVRVVAELIFTAMAFPRCQANETNKHEIIIIAIIPDSMIAIQEIRS